MSIFQFVLIFHCKRLIGLFELPMFISMQLPRTVSCMLHLLDWIVEVATELWLDPWVVQNWQAASLPRGEPPSILSPLTAALQSDDSCLVTFTFFLLQLMSLSCHILSFLLVFFWNMMLHKNDPFCQKVWDHPVIPTSTIRWLHLLLNFAFNLLTEHPTQKLSDSSKSMFDLCHLIVVIPNYVGLCYPLKKSGQKLT